MRLKPNGSEVWYEEFGYCKHPTVELCWITTRNGLRRYGFQCLSCGHFFSQGVRRDALPDVVAAEAKAVNVELRQLNKKIASAYYTLAGLIKQVEWRVKYNDYLNSPEWRAKRRRILEDCQRICSRCKENEATHVHHLTYERLGNELDSDLLPVCEGCHEALHGRRFA